MSLRIIRNDITQMNTDAIVNTANSKVRVAECCAPIMEDYESRNKDSKRA